MFVASGASRILFALILPAFNWLYSWLSLGLEALHYKPPQSDTHVAKLVRNYAIEVKKANIEVISKALKQGFQFSVTMDEWTRLGNRKLSNINLHLPDGDFLHIGLVRVRGKMPARKFSLRSSRTTILILRKMSYHILQMVRGETFQLTLTWHCLQYYKLRYA